MGSLTSSRVLDDKVNFNASILEQSTKIIKSTVVDNELMFTDMYVFVVVIYLTLKGYPQLHHH